MLYLLVQVFFLRCGEPQRTHFRFGVAVLISVTSSSSFKGDHNECDRLLAAQGCRED
ncbi:hypothetical protein [Anabaena azotica]|uniref:Uncharacterized protein n=1 Tax=Anabaena azotica FACHB-119 TaxID=947527 RepID=A0ABR8DH03_9NOST|nr:hypothetical protein [Anabaena azotica]MBD2505685.1 hypothetical protein [Anabaena azotica FACHB-119]